MSLLAHAAPGLGWPLCGGSEESAVGAMPPLPPVRMGPRGFGARPGHFELDRPSGSVTARAVIGRARTQSFKAVSYVLVAQDYNVTARDRCASLQPIAPTNDD